MKISIITPSLNSAKYLQTAINSVLLQDYENIEHIVVDGASTDGTVAVLRRYPHLKWISEPDNGQTHAMNKGYKLAAGDIVVYLNADDYFLPGAFKAVVPYFEKGEKFVVGKIRVEKDVGESFINDPRIQHEDILRHWEDNAYCYNPVGYFYRKEVIEAVNGFNENNPMQDLEFLLAASRLYRFTKIDRILGVYRDYQGTITAVSQKKKDYWTRKNFGFIQKFLDDMPADFREQYETDREEGYRKKMEFQKWKKYSEACGKKSITMFYHGCVLFLSMPEKKKWLLKKIRL
ncbi:MAG: glycosyltransferase family 2 protein [Chloroflexi bacterium]|nr:glycosyltransferase family 2 protein [Chloroflexota bacterium]